METSQRNKQKLHKHDNNKEVTVQNCHKDPQFNVIEYLRLAPGIFIKYSKFMSLT